MNQLDRFIHHVLLQFPDQSERLYQLWNSCQPSVTSELLCPILMQAGPRRGQACNRTCKHTDRCTLHHGMNMCQHPTCTRVNEKDTILCSFHNKEKQRRIELEKPVISVRYRGTHYIINKTNIVIDPVTNTIRGYVDEDRVVYESNKDVEHACAFYQVRYDHH